MLTAIASVPPKPAVILRASASSTQADSPLLPVPAGFNPLTASPAQLAAYGFPPKPSTNAAAWTNAMEHERFEAGPPLSATQAPNSSTAVSPAASGQEQGNWAGFDVQTNQNSSDIFTYATGQFVVPSISGNNLFSSYSLNDPMDAFWVGLGGSATSGSSVLFAQLGVLSVAQSTPKDYFFIEDGNIPIDNSNGTPKYVQPYRFGPSISAGQSAYVAVWYPTINGELNVEFYLENITTGASQAAKFRITSPDITDHSAECVAEWPQNHPYYLPDYGQTDFQNCEVSTNWETSLYNFPSFYYNQIGNWYDGVELQYPGALDVSHFELYWKNYCATPVCPD
jgi:hypothetical protein